MRSSFLLSLTIFFVLLSSAARAGQELVPGPSIDALQAAVEAAGAGGTVVLGSGDHVLTAPVLLTVDDVEVRAARGARILGRGGVEGDRLVLFRVKGDGVRLLDLVVAADPGNMGDLALVTVEEGDWLTVKGCSSTGLVQLVDGGEADGLLVRGNRVLAARPTATDPLPEHLMVIRSGGRAEVRIERNRIEGFRDAGTVGIETLPPEGAHHLVARNRIFGFETGILGEGAGRAEIHRNRIRRCAMGIDLARTQTALRWEIVGNRVDDVLSIGLFLGTGDGCLVKRNHITRTGSDGINLGGVFLDVVRNHVRLDAGIGIFGETDSSNFTRNRAKRCGAGIRVTGVGNRISGNRAAKNRTDGLVTTGGNINAEGNRGRRNGGQQISIQ